ncbi:MAG: hypothetical protein COA86_10725 [Kangiella sp.]|nr:MAG: hypothetical protein COA86_10725 [Kangiella sp.]
MNLKKLVLLSAILVFLNGCTAMVSSKHNKGHHSHNRVSVGVHAQGSGGLGALIIGGIIGAVINEASHESKENQLAKKKLEDKLAKEERLKAQRIQDNSDRERIISGSQVTKWYQLGKDRQCYEMQTQSGITDVLTSVDIKYCNP